MSGTITPTVRVREVRSAEAAGPPALAASHRKWWHEFYPASFLSISDGRLAPGTRVLFVTHEADKSGTQDDQWKRRVQEEDRDEGRRGNCHHHLVLERAPANAHDSFQHDRQNGGL